MITHLHWQYAKGPTALRGVVKAIAICGAKDLPREQVTSFPEDVTCKACLARHKGIGRSPQPPNIQNIPVRTEEGLKIKAAFVKHIKGT